MKRQIGWPEDVIERLDALEKDCANKTKRLRALEFEFEKKQAADGLEIAKNLNTVCLISWLCFGFKGKYRSVILNKYSNNESEYIKIDHDAQESSSGPIIRNSLNLLIVLKFLPFLIVFFEIVLLAGLLDQGFAIKRFIDGDGVYQPNSWRYFDDAVLNLTDKDFETIFASRKADDVAYCTSDQRLSDLVDFNLSQPNGHNLFWLKFYDIGTQAWLDRNYSFNNDNSLTMVWDRIFDTCMPWEYAGLCVNIMNANTDFEVAARNGLSKQVYWSMFFEYPYSCYLDCLRDDCDFYWSSNSIHTISQDMFSKNEWANLALPRSEIVAAAKDKRFPPSLSSRRQTVMWLLNIIESGKKKHDGSQDFDTLAIYDLTQFVYWLGSGEAYLVEMIAIVFLSAFFYFKSFLSELRQLLHQIELLLHVSSLEYAPGSPPSSLKSLAAWLAHIAELLLFDFFVDVFLSMRFLFVAYMVLASSMIITWDHGVFAVLLSCLVIEFLFNIDDDLYKVLASMGFEDSTVFCCRLLPIMREFALVYSDVPPGKPNNSEDEVNPCPESEQRPPPPAMANPGELENSDPSATQSAPGHACRRVDLTPQEIFNLGGVLLTAGLFILHCIQSLQIATNRELFSTEGLSTSKERGAVPTYQNNPSYFFQKIFDETRHRRIYLITGGIFLGVFAIAAGIRVADFMRGQSPKPRSRLHRICAALPVLLRAVQTGLCLIVVYHLIVSCVHGGMLAWYTEASSRAGVGKRIVSVLSRDGSYLCTCFTLYTVISGLRAISRSAQARSDNGQAQQCLSSARVLPGH